jgi:hypothetical protein
LIISPKKNTMHAELIHDMHASAREFMAALAPFRDRAFNEVPFPDSWTPGQVAEHILKAESGLPELLSAKLRPADRDPRAFIPQLREGFLDFTTKYKAAPAIMPSGDPKDWEDMVARLEANRKRIEEVLPRTDLGQYCELASFPGIGLLTGYEWLCVMNTHTLRHAHQLRHIQEVLTAA